MSKKLSRTVLVPLISLLPFTPGLALATDSHHPIENRPHATSTHVRSLVIPGKLLSQNTIQINTTNMPTADQENQARVITLTDTHGNKQRFILLPADRAAWVRELTKYNGSIEEFNFYSIVDENGNKTNLLASKRTVDAPANQLTVIFPSLQDAKLFFTSERQKSLAEAGFTSTDLQVQLNLGSAELQDQLQENEINQINEKQSEIKASFQDSGKSSARESVGIFPSVSVMTAATILVNKAPTSQ